MKIWQRGMIALACNGRLKAFMQRNATASMLAQKFVGGTDVAQAVDAARRLAQQRVQSSLYYLGEYVREADAVHENLAQTLAVVQALAGAGLGVHVSIDPTQIGYSIAPALFEQNALTIGQALGALTAARTATSRHCLMLDMEDFAMVEPTLAMRRRLAGQGIPMGQTLQAYLHRTAGDLAELLDGPNMVRLVKGAFAERPQRALQGRREIDRNYLRLASEILGDRAKKSGFYPVFGTHDDEVIREVCAIAESQGWAKGQYEFEMLYGVRTPLLHALRDQGHAVRVYLPFGRDWWPYATRRVGEAPRNALFMARAMWNALVARS
jgi:proline dehydrogenase